MAKIFSCSERNIQYFLARIKQKGIELSERSQGGDTPPKEPPSHPKRLHGQMFSVKILYYGPYYRKVRDRGNIELFGDFKVHLHKASITLYCLRDFVAGTAIEAHKDSLEWLVKTLSFLERRWHIMLLKDGYQNIKECRAHYAEMQNELGRHASEHHDRLNLKAKEDNKVWLSTDRSFSFDELETLHPHTARHDMDEVVYPWLTRLRSDPFSFEKMIYIQEGLQSNVSQIISIMQQLARLFGEAARPAQPAGPPADSAHIPDYIG